MTEDEAKTKWCPFARVFVETDEHERASPAAGVNRLEIAGTSEPDLEWPTPRCIGSACMAWRDEFVTEFIDWHTGHVLDPGQVILRGEAQQRTRVVGGYCGLAGALA